MNERRFHERRRWRPYFTMRWLYARGWAWGGAVACTLIAANLRPPYPLISGGYFIVGAFAVAAVCSALLALYPESHRFRIATVASVTFACLWRVTTLAATEVDGNFVMVGVVIWTWLAFLVATLAAVTSMAATRRGERRGGARASSRGD